MPPEFWNWFDGVLVERKLSDIKIAQMSGFSKSVISNARREEKRMSVGSLRKMADALGYPAVMVYQLAGHLDEAETGPAVSAEMLQLWDRLGDDDREEILALMKVKVKRAKQGEPQKAGR